MSEEDEVDFHELAKEKYGEKVTDLGEEKFERLEKLFHEKLEKFGNERLALTSAIGSFNFQESSGGSEETIYTVGVDGPRNFQGPTLFLYGILDPADENQSPGRIAIIAPTSDLDDPDGVKDIFSEPFQEVSANISTRAAKGVESAYVGELGTMGGGAFTVTETPEREFEERQEFVMGHLDEVQIGHMSEGLSATKDSGFAESFGADIKVIPYATILESAVSGKGARYVLQDDSFIEASDLPPEVRGEDNELGLVAYGDPDFMALDSESIVDVFGTITPNSEGQPTMDIFGYYGHYEQEAEINRSGSSSGGSAGDSDTTVTGDAVDERTI